MKRSPRKPAVRRCAPAAVMVAFRAIAILLGALCIPVGATNAQNATAEEWREIVAMVEDAMRAWEPSPVPDARGESDGLAPGHQRMLERLRAIAESAHRDSNFLGYPGGDALLAAVRRTKNPPPRVNIWGMLHQLGRKAMELGDERRAIQLLTKSLDQLPEPRGSRWVKSQLDLSVAYLRLAERENCCATSNAESCILPLKGDAIHTRREGSEGAIRTLEVLLSKLDPFDQEYREGVWLLNVAYMTLGGFPDDVPEPYRLKQELLTPKQSGFPTFRNVAPELGLDSFSLAGGVIIDDFTGDALLDIVTSTWDARGELEFFVNVGGGRFEERSRQAGLSGLLGGLNILQADYDNDGDLDILVLRGAWYGAQGRQPNSLLRNEGPGADGHVRFTDVSYDCGLAGRDFPTQAAAWADYDNDGDLDLYVGNESTSDFACASQLFRNDRLPDGRIRFTDVAAQAGVENLRMAKGVSWGDYDGDRFPDLYVSNLEGANRLYHNQRDGTFKDVAPDLGLVGPKSSFPTWFWDYDNDGLLDIYVSCYFGHVFFEASHYMGERPDRSTVPALYKGVGGGKLVNHTVPAGLADRPVLVMGANFGDLDGDGLLDFYLGTGAPSFRTIQPNLVFANSIEGRFSDVSLESGLGHLQKGHGIAMADLDHDGDLDVFEQMGGAYAGDGFHNALFENSQGSKGWLGVELRGKDSNRFGVGARIEVVPAGEDRSIFRTVSSGASFGANPLRQHIALGESQGIASLSVFWPTTGETQTWDEVPVNQVIRITEGQSEFETLGLEPVKLGGE